MTFHWSNVGKDAQWCKLAILQAGMAAEAIVLGRVSAGNASDIAESLALAEALAGADPPWAARPGPWPPFHRLYCDPPRSEVVRALRTAHAVARAAVLAHPGRHRLCEALAAKRELDESDVSLALGPRSMVRALGALRATIVVL